MENKKEIIRYAYSSLKESADVLLHDDDEFKLAFVQTQDKEFFIENKVGSTYGFVYFGNVALESPGANVTMNQMSYFCVSEKIKIKILPNSFLMYINNKKLAAMNAFGGPVEDKGRLKYIDGCTDTVLLTPSRLGEACLNFLHFPPGTTQTMHSHPSFRFGIVARGSGQSVSPIGKIDLLAGDVFLIPKNVDHKFDTAANLMDVIAFHPDSDWGPTDEVHPMINRTWVDGAKIKT